MSHMCLQIIFCVILISGAFSFIQNPDTQATLNLVKRAPIETGAHEIEGHNDGGIYGGEQPIDESNIPGHDPLSDAQEVSRILAENGNPDNPNGSPQENNPEGQFKPYVPDINNPDLLQWRMDAAAVVHQREINDYSEVLEMDRKKYLEYLTYIEQKLRRLGEVQHSRRHHQDEINEMITNGVQLETYLEEVSEDLAGSEEEYRSLANDYPSWIFPQGETTDKIDAKELEMIRKMYSKLEMFRKEYRKYLTYIEKILGILRKDHQDKSDSDKIAGNLDDDRQMYENILNILNAEKSSKSDQTPSKPKSDDEQHTDSESHEHSHTHDGHELEGTTNNSKSVESSAGCFDGMFQCSNGTCIPSFQRCDRHSDCYDHSDEIGCIGWKNIKYIQCNSNEFHCWDGTCIYSRRQCDFHPDCSDASDEVVCDWDGYVSEISNMIEVLRTLCRELRRLHQDETNDKSNSEAELEMKWNLKKLKQKLEELRTRHSRPHHQHKSYIDVELTKKWNEYSKYLNDLKQILEEFRKGHSRRHHQDNSNSGVELEMKCNECSKYINDLERLYSELSQCLCEMNQTYIGRRHHQVEKSSRRHHQVEKSSRRHHQVEKSSRRHHQVEKSSRRHHQDETNNKNNSGHRSRWCGGNNNGMATTSNRNSDRKNKKKKNIKKLNSLE